MEIRDFYGNNSVEKVEVKEQPKTQTTITVRENEVKREMPPNAEIVEETIDIMVEPIENGWIKTVNKYCRFKVKSEEGEESEDYHDSYYDTKRYYSKNKPVDIELTYAV